MGLEWVDKMVKGFLFLVLGGRGAWEYGVLGQGTGLGNNRLMISGKLLWEGPKGLADGVGGF